MAAPRKTTAAKATPRQKATGRKPATPARPKAPTAGAAKAARSRKAATVTPITPPAPSATYEDLRRSLKSAKGVLWTMNHRGSTAEKIAAQEAKVEDLKAQVAQVAPARGYDGPAWVVSIDATNGATFSKRAENGAEARDLAGAARQAGLTVTVVRTK